MKRSSTKLIYWDLKSLNLEQESTQWVKLGIPEPQQGQQEGQSGETLLLLIKMFTSNLNPHLMRPIQKNPRENMEYFEERECISFLKPNLYFLYFSDNLLDFLVHE